MKTHFNMDSKDARTFGRSRAIALIILLGTVSLFADMNYEGGRSLSGQYLNLLGASAFALSLAIGFPALLALFFVELFTAPLIFLGGTTAIVAGMVLWGFSTGTQESALKAVIADYSSKDFRGRAFGFFQTVFVAFWFAGSALLGWLYGLSVPIMVAASVFFQGITLVMAFAAKNALQREVIV